VYELCVEARDEDAPAPGRFTVGVGECVSRVSDWRECTCVYTVRPQRSQRCDTLKIPTVVVQAAVAWQASSPTLVPRPSSTLHVVEVHRTSTGTVLHYGTRMYGCRIQYEY
jgi:hypothetical protein